ncbi:MAG TPA: segregation/condensation protein A [Terriglobia bacterium]|nr:segregation/condensation protein A [Terriglobia bacterium]
MDEIQEPTPEIPGADEAAAPAVKRVSRAEGSPPAIKLEIYEGPLDLLLDLIRKQEINIYDIPIAKITKQYLDYLHLLEEMNIDVAGEFIFMAATLIYIKSRMLLPVDPTAPPEEQEDPRAELVHRLLEHEQFKNAAQMLASKRMVEDAAWSAPGIGEFVEAEDEPGFTVTVFDLVAVFREIIERAKKRPQMEIHREHVTVAQMVEHVKAVLTANPHPIRLDDLFAGYVARQALIALLLALLEMVRLHAVILRQKELFAPIVVHKNKRFEEIMSGVKVAELEASFEESNALKDEGNVESTEIK